MSIPNAVLAYGVVLTSDQVYDLPFEAYDFEEWLLARAKAGPIDYDKRKAIIKACPVATLLMDYDDTQMVVAVQGSLTETDWDGAVRPVMTVPAEAIQAAQAFCAEHGIPFDDPDWLLAAYMRA